MADYAGEWQLIKTNYENATGRKKPAKGFFNSASGLEKAAKALDKALGGSDPKAAVKARAGFVSASDAYQKVLFKKAAAEKDKDIATELRVMIGELDLLENKAAVEVDMFVEATNAVNARYSAWELVIEEVCASTLFKVEAAKKFTSKPEFGNNFVIGKPDENLEAARQKVRTCLIAYRDTLAQIKKVKPRAEGLDKSSLKKFIELYHVAGDHLSLISGAVGALGEWRLALEGPLKATQGAGLRFAGSQVKVVVDTLNEALSAENERMAKIELAFERQVSLTR